MVRTKQVEQKRPWCESTIKWCSATAMLTFSQITVKKTEFEPFFCLPRSVSKTQRVRRTFSQTVFMCWLRKSKHPSCCSEGPGIKFCSVTRFLTLQVFTYPVLNFTEQISRSSRGVSNGIAAVLWFFIEWCDLVGLIKSLLPAGTRVVSCRSEVQPLQV